MEFVAGSVWGQIADVVAASVRKQAAIAYAGRLASRLLPLRAGDTVVVDAGDDALTSGSTSPEAIAAWLRAGAVVRSLPGLHAKVLLLEDADGRATAVIGSANVSSRSRDRLLEAAVVSDDEALCDEVRQQLATWTVLGDRIDETWLSQARQVYRAPRSSSAAPHQRRVRIDERARLWLGQLARPSGRLPEIVERVVDRAQHHHGADAVVEAWVMFRGDEQAVRAGDNVVLVANPGERSQPHGNASAWPPAEVAWVQPTIGRRRPVAVLVRDATADPVRFADVSTTLSAAGGQVDWDEPLPVSVAQAVYGLWP